MAKDYRVVNSIDSPDKTRCVDIIELDQSGFQFQEWRREPEDLSGWILMGDSRPIVYESAQQALAAAREAVVWLCDVIR